MPIIIIMIDKLKEIPSAEDLITDPQNKEKPSLQKTRGITADMVARVEAMFKANPSNPAKLSSTNHKKKKEKLPPSNYIG
jgi:hypothetical protein